MSQIKLAYFHQHRSELLFTFMLTSSNKSQNAFSDANSEVGLQLQGENSLVPLSKLPPELINEILIFIVEEAETTTEKAIDESIEKKGKEGATLRVQPFFWLSVTQFCVRWRDAALGNPVLWTHIWMLSPELSRIFVERSQDHSLHVNTWVSREADTTMYDDVFKLILANVQRIRSLHLYGGFSGRRLHRLRNVPAPRLEALRFSNVKDYYFRRSLSSPVDANVMPKLRKLYIYGESEGEWNILLPSHLPTITNVTLDRVGTDIRCQLDLVKRCTAVRHLRMIGIAGNQNQVLDYPSPILLSYLQELEVGLVPFFIPSHFISPAASLIKIAFNFDADFRAHLDEAFSGLARSLESFRNPRRPVDKHIRWLSIAYLRGGLTVLAHNSQSAILAMWKIDDINPSQCSPHHSAYSSFYRRLLQLSQSIGIGISKISTGVREFKGTGLKMLFYSLRGHWHVSNICIQSRQGFMDFLSLSQFRRPECSSRAMQAQYCDCKKCDEVRFMSYPGLAVVGFYNVDEALPLDDTKSLKMLFRWLEGRKKRMLGLRRMVLRCVEVKVEKHVLDMLRQFVDDIEVQRVISRK